MSRSLKPVEMLRLVAVLLVLTPGVASGDRLGQDATEIPDYDIPSGEAIDSPSASASDQPDVGSADQPASEGGATGEERNDDSAFADDDESAAEGDIESDFADDDESAAEADDASAFEDVDPR